MKNQYNVVVNEPKESETVSFQVFYRSYPDGTLGEIVCHNFYGGIIVVKKNSIGIVALNAASGWSEESILAGASLKVRILNKGATVTIKQMSK